MEAAEPGPRQSGSVSAATTDKYQTSAHSYLRQPYREGAERSTHEPPAMATATLLHPTTTYSSPASYSAGFPPSSSSMISSANPRLGAEENDASKRQSLPSISEVISNTKSNPYPAPAPSGAQPNSSFSLTGPFRSYETDKHPSPQTSRPASSYPPHRDPQSSFNGSPTSSFNGRPSLPPVTDQRSLPATKSDFAPHAYPQESQKDHRAVNGAYPHPPPPTAPSSAASYPTGALPHGQMPLPPYPHSPRHAPTHGYASYEQRAQPNHIEDGERVPRPPFEHSMYTAPWNYGESLGRLAQASRTLYSFAEAYGRIAQEQHGVHPIPERLPTEQEVNDMLSNLEMSRTALERVRDAVQQSIRNERAREAPKMKSAYEDDQDAAMYDDGIKSQYAITEVKKRRGRAAPPGRCHSCNRVDTPEWRRGPDGARTLCNACGLHYAKLERKRQLEQRNIRPKPEDRS